MLVVAALMVSYASSLRAYLEQRQHLSQLEGDITASEANISQLEREKARWDDPAYVISQARARFAFGFPGEVGYQVLDRDGKPLDPQDTLSPPRPATDDEPEWWETTLSSIDAAAHPPAEEAPPVTKIRPDEPIEKPAS